MLDLIIKNGQCYIDGELKDADVAVKDGKIHKEICLVVLKVKQNSLNYL